MPRFSWFFNATQAPSKNVKENPRETQGEEGELSTPTKFDSIEDLSKSDGPSSWLTWLRKAADLQRKSRQSFYIDPPVIDIWNSSSSSLTSDPVSRPSTTEPSSPKKAAKVKSSNNETLYDPSLASEYNKEILAYISTGTVPKPKSSPKKSSKQSQKTVRFELEATTASKKEEIVPKLNMQNSRIIFQSSQLTVILTPPEEETQISTLGPGLIERTGSKTPARYKSTRERGGERRNPFLSIRNYRLGNGSVDGIHTNTNTNTITRNFPNRSSPNLSYPPFHPGDYHSFNPHLNTAQNPRFSTSSLHPTLSPYHIPLNINSRSNVANPTLLHPNPPPQYNPYLIPKYEPTPRYNPHLLTPPPPSLPDARRIKRQNELRELKELREFMIEVLNREGGQLKKGIRGKIMGLYGIGDGDLEGGSFDAGTEDVGQTDGGNVRGYVDRREGGDEGRVKRVDEGVDFGCEKEDLRSLEMVFRGRFSGSWDTGSMRGMVSV